MFTTKRLRFPAHSSGAHVRADRACVTPKYLHDTKIWSSPVRCEEYRTTQHSNSMDVVRLSI
jgi:hypothetical protein